MQNSEQQSNSTYSVEQEATRGWMNLLESVQRIKQRQEDENDQLRIQMTRNYASLMMEMKKQNQEEMAKKWIRENLEEAQLFIDQFVGIKGITEDPLKVAAELEGDYSDSNVIAANTEATLQAQFVEPEPTTITATATSEPSEPSSQPLPRVSISSSIVPPSDELYGY